MPNNQISCDKFYEAFFNAYYEAGEKGRELDKQGRGAGISTAGAAISCFFVPILGCIISAAKAANDAYNYADASAAFDQAFDDLIDARDDLFKCIHEKYKLK